jgi:uncharacterized protein YdaT
MSQLEREKMIEFMNESEKETYASGRGVPAAAVKSQFLC